jgi:hypothetical protein
MHQGDVMPDDPLEPVVHRGANTHVHLPPNFSAFTTAEDAVAAAAAQGVLVIGASNFHDTRVYGRFREAAEAAGILPLFGLELISVLDEPADRDVRVNDPANPGRMYLCGKGIDPDAEPTPLAREIAGAARASDELRARAIVARLRDHLAAHGLDADLDDAAIVDAVAERAGVPRDWVVLQERHIAMAVQEWLFLQVAPERRADVLARLYDAPPAAPAGDAVAVQGEIRSRLMKAGRVAFVAESPLTFERAYRLVLERGGIPCYPTLADGASPVCPWEEPPATLAERLLDREIHVAELIPGRNDRAIVDAYATAFRDAGIVVMAGTEHNTQERIPVEPRCRDGEPPSSAARSLFWEGACVVAAHQHERANGRPGYVDADGNPAGGFPDTESRIRWFRELGASVIAAAGAPG